MNQMLLGSRAIAAGLLLLLLPSVAMTEPKFSDYPAASYSGSPHTLVISSDRDKKFASVLQSAYPADANFAGEYVFVSWTVDEACSMAAAISVRTGLVSYLPVSVCPSEDGKLADYSFKKASTLLIAAGTVDRPGLHYFELGQNGFKGLDVAPSQFEQRKQRLALLSKIYDDDEPRYVHEGTTIDQGFGWRSVSSQTCIPWPHDLKELVEKWEIADGQLQGCDVVDHNFSGTKYIVNLSCGNTHAPAKVIWEKDSPQQMTRLYSSPQMGSSILKFLRCDVPSTEYTDAQKQIRDVDCDLFRALDDINALRESLILMGKNSAAILAQVDPGLSSRLAALSVDLSSKGWEQGNDETPAELEARSMKWASGTTDAAQETLRVVNSGISLAKGQKLNVDLETTLRDFEKVAEQMRQKVALLPEGWRSREGAVSGWASQGFQLDNKFYGRASICVAKDNVFDGVWTWANQPAFEIAGKTFRFLSTREIKGGGECVPSYSEFSYTSKKSAWVKYRLSCPDGTDGMRGMLQFAFVNGDVKYAECSGAGDGQEPNNCLPAAEVENMGFNIDRK